MSDLEVGRSNSADSVPQGLYEQYGPPSDPWDPRYLAGEQEDDIQSGPVDLVVDRSVIDESFGEDPTLRIVADREPSQTLATNERSAAENQADTRGRARRAVEWMRRNKATTFAGGVLVGSLIANPLGKGLEHLDWSIGAKVLGAVAIAEAFWIGGAAIAWKAAGGKLTLNPFKIKEAFKSLSRQSVKDNRALFNTGVTINTTAAVAQMAVPSAAIVANLPPSYWGLVSLAALELWATFQVRRKIYDVARGPKPSTTEPTID